MKGSYFLIIIIVTVITIIFWAAADIVHSRSQVAIPSDTQQLLQHIDTNFDLQALDE